MKNFPFSSNLDNKSNKELTLVIDIINLFTVAIENFHQKLESKLKDFIILAATAWSMVRIFVALSEGDVD